jgi:Bacterial regulatory proteins, tetR family
MARNSCAEDCPAVEVTTTSPSRRIERKERLRGEILAAASKMFADRGYEAVTLRAIAKEIGYTHAVIYQLSLTNGIFLPS